MNNIYTCFGYNIQMTNLSHSLSLSLSPLSSLLLLSLSLSLFSHSSLLYISRSLSISALSPSIYRSLSLSSLSLFSLSLASLSSRTYISSLSLSLSLLSLSISLHLSLSSLLLSLISPSLLSLSFSLSSLSLFSLSLLLSPLSLLISSLSPLSLSLSLLSLSLLLSLFVEVKFNLSFTIILLLHRHLTGPDIYKKSNQTKHHFIIQAFKGIIHSNMKMCWTLITWNCAQAIQDVNGFGVCNISCSLIIAVTHLFILENVNWWTGVVWIIVMFYQLLDSHSDGTHSLQSIHCWDTDAVLHFSDSR